MVDSYDFSYSEELCIEAIGVLLTKQDDWHGKYEYVSHELIFAQPIKLNDAEFELAFTDKCQAKYNS